MKVLFDHQIFCEQIYGGISRYHMELKKNIENIKDTKIIIPVIFPINKYLYEYENRKTFSIKNKWIIRFIKALNRIYTIFIIKQGKFDIIHPTWHASYINYIAKGKLIITVHDMIHEIYYPNKKKDIERKKRSIYESTAIIAISKNTKADILKFYGDISENKIRVIYHGTTHLPKPERPSKFDVPEKYILFVGKREGYKNAIVLIQAFNQLKLKYQDIELVMVGGGSFQESEKAEMGDIEKIKQISVTDAELAYLYSNAICFVYPSKYEGFGFPVLEAFDNHCPVVLSNASCLPEIGGDAAMYFEPDNSKELSLCIEKMISDPILRNDFVRKGTEQGKKFTWEETANETYKLYQEIANT